MNKTLLLFWLFVLCSPLSVAQDTLEGGNINSWKYNYGYVESLSKQAKIYFSVENYDEAIRIAKEGLLILEHLSGQFSLEYAICEAELALYIANTGQYKESIFLAENALKKIEKIEGKKSTLYAITADKLSTYYSLLGDFNKALVYIKQAIESFGNNYETNRDYYVSLKSSLATIYTKLHRIQDAIDVKKECNDYYSNKGDSVKYAIGLHDLSLAYAASGDYSKAINLCETSSKMLLHHLGLGDLLYRESLKTLADYYGELGDFDNVHKISMNHVQLCKEYGGENSHDYIRALSNQAFYYSKEGNYKKAIELEEYVLSLQEKGNILDSLDYAITLSNLAMFKRELGYIDKAIALDEQSLCILNSYPTTKAYRGVLSDLSSCYLSLGDFEKSIELIGKVLNMLQDRKDSEYYGYLGNLANCYYRMNQTSKAISIYTEVLQNQETLIGKKNLDYIATFENLASCYSSIGNYRNAIVAEEECIDLLIEIFGINNPQCAFSLLTLGNYYYRVGEDKKAIELQEKAIKSLKNVSESGIRYIDALNQLVSRYREQEPEYALLMAEKAYELLKTNFIKITSTHIRCIENLIHIYISLGQFDNAKKKCYTDFETSQVYEYLKKNQDDYISFLHTKSQLSFAMQDYNDAIAIEKKALEISKSYDNIADEQSIIKLLMCYAVLNDTTSMIKLFKENNLIEATRNKLLPNIKSLTSKNRFSYWAKRSSLFTDILPFLATVSKDSAIICQTYDNSALFAKSLLLRTEKRIFEIVRNSNDESLKMMYKQYQINKSSLNRNFQDSITKANLIKTNILLEDEILQRLLSMHLVTDLSATWKNVQQCIGQDDVVIEFISFQIANNSEAYIALVIKKDYSCPHLYTLSKRENIIAAKNNSPSDLFNLIWAPLQDELEDTKNIFFTPAGELYNLGIEYLNDSTGCYLFDKHSIYRLSSTQELLYSHLTGSLKSAFLYGGLDYSSYSNILSHKPVFEGKVPDISFSYQNLIRSITERGGFEPLYETGIEIESVSKILQKNNVKCKTYLGREGTEESFKSLVNELPDIIHIATHGLYIKLEDKSDWIKKNNFSFILSEDDDNLHPEDIALTRSFIVMSGGNQLILRDSIPLNVEDGIVTAQEISQMDFHNTELVVLSACQTGLGDISNEGVYGLQRGFKKAGAHTILMSLDKVDDEATKILMVEFYRNLMDGKTKLQSLRNAQNHLRSVEYGKYDDPKYWASFILLDGLN